MYLNIKNLHIEREKKSILHGLTLYAEKGQFLTVLGPSGCGKSTLLKSIAGIFPIKSGEISLNGINLSTLLIHKRKTVLVFQDMRLFPHMNVVENIAFPLKMQGVNKKKRLDIAWEFLEKVQLQGYDTRRISSLSGGEQQRVSMARAFASRPDLLLLDEPFTALDGNLREDMLNLTLSLHKELGMTTLLVTHDRQEALAVSDSIALMFEGNIAQQGTPAEVYMHPKSPAVADYFGDCGYIQGEIISNVFYGNGFSCPVNISENPSANLSVNYVDGKYRMMIRSRGLIPDEQGILKVQVRSIHFQGAEFVVTLQAELPTELEEKAIWKKSFHECPNWKIGSLLSCNIDIKQVLFFPN